MMLLNNARIDVTIPVVDLERAKAFYTDKLDLRPLPMEDPAMAAENALFEGGDCIRLALFKPAKRSKAEHTLAGFQVDNLETTVRELKSRGVEFEHYKMPGATIDKERLIRAAYDGDKGEPAVSMCPKGMLGHLELEDRKPDPAAARTLLAEAGFPDGFETELWHGDVQRAYLPDPDGVAIQIQQDLKEIGIRARIRKVEWSAYIPATQRGEHPMCLLGWMADIGDPDNFLYVLLDKDNARVGSANNVSFYSGEKVHELLLAAQKSYDTERRVQLYHEAQRILFQEVPTIPLVTVPDFRILRNEVSGYTIYPAGGEYFRKVSLER